MNLSEELSKIESDIDVLVYSELEISALKILYDNSLRLGNIDNYNVTIASVHPNLWFHELLPYFSKCLKLVPKRSSYFVHTIESGNLFRQSLTTETKQFHSDQEIKDFFEKDCEFKNLSIFGICKYVDIINLKIQWHLRYNDISNIQSLRDNKLESLINI